MNKDAAVIETMLLRWSDGPNGRTVTLLLPSDDAEHPFRGLKCGPAHGQRLALSVALIADDESKTNLGNGVVPTESKYKPSDKSPRPVTVAHAPKTGGAHRSFHEMSATQQAGLLSNERRFYSFMLSRLEVDQHLQEYANDADTLSESCARLIRGVCGVNSRSDIKSGTPAEKKWRELASDYRAWVYEPAVVPA